MARMPNAFRRDPDLAEVAVFAALCALALFVPPTPLVAHFAAFANARDIAADEAASMLIVLVFGGLAALAMVVSLLFATVRRALA